MPAFEIEELLDDKHAPRGKHVQVLTLGSAPAKRLYRTVRIIGANISATAATVVWVNLGKFSVPVNYPVAASPTSFQLELYNSTIAPIEITDFSIAASQIPAGATGTLTLFLVEH
jgi:hypothetical protein